MRNGVDFTLNSSVGDMLSYISRSVRDLIDNNIKLLRQIKGDPSIHTLSPQPKISEAPSKVKYME